MGAEAEPITISEHHDDFHHDQKRVQRRRRVACFTGCLSHLVLFKLLFVLGAFAFMSLRAPQTITLDPFENVALRFCPSWVRGVDVVAPFPASEWVRAHRINGEPTLVNEPELFNVGYNVSLHSDHHTRTHMRSYHFPQGSTFDVEFESTAPVSFVLVHPEHREQHGRKWSPRQEGHHNRPHPHPHRPHGERYHDKPHNAPASENSAAPSAPAAENHSVIERAQFRISASGGQYDFVFFLPRNTTANARVNVKIAANIRSLDVSSSCPLMSSLNRGEKHIRVEKQEAHRVVLSASPYARGASVVHVHLVPREHKFLCVSAFLFAIFAVLRLVSRFFRAHAVKRGEGKKCFWSRLCGKKATPVQYSPIIQVETVQN